MRALKMPPADAPVLMLPSFNPLMRPHRFAHRFAAPDTRIPAHRKRLKKNIFLLTFFKESPGYSFSTVSFVGLFLAAFVVVAFGVPDVRAWRKAGG